MSGVVTQKITAGNLFDCSNLADFIASIVQVLPFKGISMSRFYDCDIDGVRFLTKLCFYRKSAPELYGKKSKNTLPHTDAEINILRVFKKRFTDRNITPCILELVYYKVCNSLSKITPRNKVCEQLVLEYKDYGPAEDVAQTICKHADLVHNGLAHDKCAFLVLDKCDITLDTYLQRSVNTPISTAVFKSLLFQIIYTLYAINKVYPKFRHYDLHTENIMLKFDPTYKFKATNQKFLVFTIDGEKYYMPYFGIIPKIIDFGFSSLPEEGIVSNAVEDRAQMYFRSQNDLLLLFHWIYHILKQSGGDKLGRIDKLLQHLEPNRTYVQYYTEYIRKVETEIPTYEDMIKNRVWSEYKNSKVRPNQIYAEYTPVK
jgi:serine/threonine protein kinase